MYWRNNIFFPLSLLWRSYLFIVSLQAFLKMAAGKFARILSYRLEKLTPSKKVYFCFCFCFSNACDHSPFVRPTFLKLGCTVNFHMLYFMVAFVCLVNNSSFMLIRSCHFELGLLTLTPVPSPPTHIGTVISPTQPLVYKTTQKCSRKFTKRWTYTWGSLVWVLHMLLRT